MEVQEEAQNNHIMKGKRTKRPRLSLTMTSSSSTTAELGFGSGGGFDTATTTSPASSGGLTDRSIVEEQEEEQDMAKCLILLAQGQNHKSSTSTMSTNWYPCKTCDRCFPSFQALGGHRASHKRSKANEEEKRLSVLIHDDQVQIDHNSVALSLETPNRVLLPGNMNMSRVHECSTCGAEFSSGQALGGHMRRHRTVSVAKQTEEVKNYSRSSLGLDLNLPAPDDDHRESKFAFASKKQVIVFSASSLVDCHY